MQKTPLAIGLDASTQSVKALALGPGGIEAIAAVNFGRDLPQFGAPEGFIPCPADPALHQAPPEMWAEGMRLALLRLGDMVDLSCASCIAGAAQQHGLVCTDASGAPVFPLAPIWMDATTSPDCHTLDARFGNALRERTGSSATERFTGPQAHKAARKHPDAWPRVAHCHAIASYLNSLLIGATAPCDPGTASGQNLYDLATGNWAVDIAEFTAPDLLRKLPRIVPSDVVSGTLAATFAVGGLPVGIPVVIWTGDNPDSLLGMGFSRPGEAVVSLGTSDTLFAAMDAPRTDPSSCGNVFCTSAGGFMALTCFTNGSLAREAVKRETGVDWDFFDNGFAAETAPGNDGRLMLPWYTAETTPHVLQPSVHRNFREATPAQRIRAILESQALAIRHHAIWMAPRFARIGVTGGASKSDGFLRILADVFQTRVERLQATETVALGAAMRAWAHITGEPLAAISARLCKPAAVFEPDPAIAPVYSEALARYAAFLSSVQ